MLKAAVQKFGTSSTRPQDQCSHFMAYLRALNTGHGAWGNWPEATVQVREAVKGSEIPQEVFNMKYADPWMYNTIVNAEIVSSEEKYENMMKDVKLRSIISLDYECHTDYSYNGLLALISLTTEIKTYLIDPFALRDTIMTDFVPKVLTNGNLLKVMIGCQNDVLYTQSNFGAFLNGVLDMQKYYLKWKEESPEDCWNTMSKVFRKKLNEARNKKCRQEGLSLTTTTIPRVKESEVKDKWINQKDIGYKDLVEALFWNQDVIIEKLGQRADFRVRPLGDLATYAANDVHYLLRAFFILKTKVTQSGLARSFQETKDMLKKTFKLQKYHTADKIIKEKNIQLSSNKARELFDSIHCWRDHLAKVVDESPEIILPWPEMRSLAENGTEFKSPQEMLNSIKDPNNFTVKNCNHLFAVLKKDEAFLCTIRDMVCHNCLFKSHQAWECPYPVDPNRLKNFMNMPENILYKMKQNARRANNYYKNHGI